VNQIARALHKIDRRETFLRECFMLDDSAPVDSDGLELTMGDLRYLVGILVGEREMLESDLKKAEGDEVQVDEARRGPARVIRLRPVEVAPSGEPQVSVEEPRLPPAS